MALITNNISGSASGQSRIGITGSVIFANVPQASFPSFPGTDVVFFVSGSSDSLGTQTPGVALFGGDVRVSGSLLVGTGSIRVTSNEITFANSAKITQRNAGTISFLPRIEVTGSIRSTSLIYTENYYAGGVDTLSTTPVAAENFHFYISQPPSDPQIVNLLDGRVPGQVAYFTKTSATGDTRITPSNTLGSWTRIDLPKTIGASATFVWTGSDWAYMGGYLATVV